MGCPTCPSNMRVCRFRHLRTQNWLGCLDSNQERLIQSQLCYHYTTRQAKEDDNKPTARLSRSAASAGCGPGK